MEYDYLVSQKFVTDKLEVIFILSTYEVRPIES